MRWLLLLIVMPLSLRAQDPALEHARQVNLEHVSNMPNFVADETVVHYVAKGRAARANSIKWERDYTVEDEVTVRGIQISRRNVRRNGKPFDKVIFGMPTTGFGAALKPLFDPTCPTALDPAGNEELSGKSALVYRFRSPENGCFGDLNGGWAYNPARTGRVLIDPLSGEVIQFEEEATGMPRGFVFTQRNQVMTWNSVKIGDASHWLPVSADFIWRMSDGSLTRATVEYRNH